MKAFTGHCDWYETLEKSRTQPIVMMEINLKGEIKGLIDALHFIYEFLKWSLQNESHKVYTLISQLQIERDQKRNSLNFW